jgi:hypothetical protein
MGIHERELGLTVERALSGQALVKHATEGIDVGAVVDRAARDLLRRHVVDRPDEAAVAGQAADGGHVSGEAEVAHVGVFRAGRSGDEDVRRLDVPMNEPRGVRRVERGGHLSE